MLPICNNKLYIRKKKGCLFSCLVQRPHGAWSCVPSSERVRKPWEKKGRPHWRGGQRGINSRGVFNGWVAVKGYLGTCKIFFFVHFFLLPGIAQKLAHDGSRRGRSADTAGWFAAFSCFLPSVPAADKVLLVCQGALFKEETALPETSELTGSPTSHCVSHCSGAHAITFYPERRGKHVLMAHSGDCLSSRKAVL